LKTSLSTHALNVANKLKDLAKTKPTSVSSKQGPIDNKQATIMPKTSLLPRNYIERLAVNSASISSAEICKLTEEFSEWQKVSFINDDMDSIVNSRAEFVDLILTKLWVQHQLDEYQVSLLAVGGYGRGELLPHSDVDILL